MKFKVGQRQDVLEPGVYKAAIVDIQQVTRFNKPQLDFYFEIREGKYRDAKLLGFVNANYESFSSHTKLYRWYVAATGDELEPGADFELKDFSNKILNVEVETKIAKKTKNKFSNVIEILGVHCEL